MNLHNRASRREGNPQALICYVTLLSTKTMSKSFWTVLRKKKKESSLETGQEREPDQVLTLNNHHAVILLLKFMRRNMKTLIHLIPIKKVKNKIQRGNNRILILLIKFSLTNSINPLSWALKPSNK